jgi:hypothetical protein
MYVLIAIQNKEVVEKLLGSPLKKPEQVSKNTMTFRIGAPAFKKLLQNSKNAGYNPYALFNWDYGTQDITMDHK